MPLSAWTGALQEFRIRGVKTNIPFLLNLIDAPDLPRGDATTTVHRRDAGAVPDSQPRRIARPKLLSYLGDVIVNGQSDVQGTRPIAAATASGARLPTVTTFDRAAQRARDRQAAGSSDPSSFATWVREQKRLLVTDTTMRDAHQSLLATRMRTYDMLRHRRRRRPAHAELFSARDVGRGDVRHVDAVPAGRSRGTGWPSSATRIPNILFQMLLRGAQRRRLHELSGQRRPRVRQRSRAAAGIDIFRIFDSLNWLPQPGARDRRGARGHARDLRSRDLLHRRHPRSEARPSTRSKYYVEAGEGAGEAWARTCSASRTWPGCASRTPRRELVKALREEIGVPIHFHTHDTSGINAGSVLRAADAGRRHRRCAPSHRMSGHDQPAESERARGRPAAYARATRGLEQRRARRHQPTIGRRCASSTTRSKRA